MSLSYNNFMKVRGYVKNFKILEFDSGFKMANVTITDSNTNNSVFVKIFNSKNLKYDGQPTTLEGLKTIFMDSDGKPRGILVEVNGRSYENKYTSSDGTEKVSDNNVAFSINPYDDEETQGAALKVKGIVEAIKYGEDKDGQPVAKLRVGTIRLNKDKDITGVETVTIVAHGDVAEKMEDEGVARGTSAMFKCAMINIMPKRDVYGDFIGESKKENDVKSFSDFEDEDEIDEDYKLYKKAKKLEKGEIIKVKKDDEVEDVKPVKEKGFDVDDELDF